MSGSTWTGCGRRRGSWRYGRGSGVALALVLAGLVASTLAAPAAAAVQPPPVEEFVPIDELPEEDRLPAAPFLIAAYSIVWVLAFGYFWLLSRRMGDVERELAELSRRRPASHADDAGEAV